MICQRNNWKLLKNCLFQLQRTENTRTAFKTFFCYYSKIQNDSVFSAEFNQKYSLCRKSLPFSVLLLVFLDLNYCSLHVFVAFYFCGCWRLSTFLTSVFGQFDLEQCIMFYHFIIALLSPVRTTYLNFSQVQSSCLFSAL